MRYLFGVCTVAAVLLSIAVAGCGGGEKDPTTGEDASMGAPVEKPADANAPKAPSKSTTE